MSQKKKLFRTYNLAFYKFAYELLFNQFVRCKNLSHENSRTPRYYRESQLIKTINYKQSIVSINMV